MALDSPCNAAPRRTAAGAGAHANAGLPARAGVHPSVLEECSDLLERPPFCLWKLRWEQNDFASRVCMRSINERSLLSHMLRSSGAGKKIDMSVPHTIMKTKMAAPVHTAE